MTQIGSVVGVEVADPFNPDAEPVVRPGLVVKSETRDDGNPDVITVVVFADDGSQSVTQVSEGAGLASLDDAGDDVAVKDDPDYAGIDGQADTDTIGDGTAPQGHGSTDTTRDNPASPGTGAPRPGNAFGNTHS